MATDPKFVGILVPPALVALVESTQEESGHGRPKKSLEKACKEYVETVLGDFVSQNRIPVVSVGESPVALKDACDTVLHHLDSDHQRLIHTFAKERKLPIEAFIMSALVRTKERGETNVVLHEWLQKAPIQPEIKAVAGSHICEHCQQPFEAAYDDQRFCPEPADGSDSCGRKFNMAKIKADIESRRRPPSQFAPPASMRMRATIV